MSTFKDGSFDYLFNYPALNSRQEEIWLYCTKKNEYGSLIKKVFRVDSKHFPAYGGRKGVVDPLQIILDTASDYSIKYMVYVSYVNVKGTAEQFHIIRKPRFN